MTTRSDMNKALEPRQPATKTNGTKTAPAPKGTPGGKAPTEAAADKAKAPAKPPVEPSKAMAQPATEPKVTPPDQPAAAPENPVLNEFVTADKLMPSAPAVPGQAPASPAPAQDQPAAGAPAQAESPTTEGQPGPEKPAAPAPDPAALKILADYYGVPSEEIGAFLDAGFKNVSPIGSIFEADTKELLRLLKVCSVKLDRARSELHKTYDDREEAYHTWKKKEALAWKSGATQGTNEQDRRAKAYLHLEEEILDHKVLMINEDFDKMRIAKLEDRIRLILKLLDIRAAEANECHLPVNKLTGLLLRKKSGSVWQGDSSP